MTELPGTASIRTTEGIDVTVRQCVERDPPRVLGAAGQTSSMNEQQATLTVNFACRSCLVFLAFRQR
jgi:hypothetical protein